MLKFQPNGVFRILQINDFQDDETVDPRSAAFLRAVLDKYRPDLAVLAGDQLSPDRLMTREQMQETLRHQLQPLEERGIPFLYTFGNHDHDQNASVDSAGQAELYDAYAMSRATHNGPDPGTYNTIVYARDGKTPKLNIYMMDSNKWYGDFMDCGVDEPQVQWYRATSDALKEQNGGDPLPSLLFQHIPVKEMFKFLKVVPNDTPGAVGSPFDSEKYVLDDKAELIGDRNVLGENICCENPKRSTGQYEAWVEKGDIIGAYFGHDHVNTFVGKTEDGIVMGYNGGFGFETYGDENERYARIYDFSEDDVTGYRQTTLYYSREVENADSPAAEA